MEDTKSDSIEIKLPTDFTKKFRKNPWILSTIVLAILIVLLLVSSFDGSMNNLVSAERAGEIVLETFEVQLPGAELELISSEEVGSSLYNVILSIDGQLGTAYVTRDGKFLIQDVIPLEEISGDDGNDVASSSSVNGSTFLDSGDEICTDSEGKPQVFLISTTTCPHCVWIKDTFDGLENEAFASQINLQHWEVDTGDNTLTSAVESEVPAEILSLYQKYNPEGYVPTFVIGCKYFRVGNGYESQDDLVSELADFKLIINKLLE